MKDFEILVLEGAYPSSVAMSRDILDAAARMAAMRGTPVPTWGLYSIGGGRVSLRDGISVETTRLPPRRPGSRAICVIPGLGADPQEVLAQMRTPDGLAIARRLARHVAIGGQVAASCSAVFVLHAAGLLDGRRVTTTWWLAPALARLAPTTTVDADRMVCADGPVVTAGAASAHADLMLHLLRERFGPRLSEQVSKMLLLEPRHSQSTFVVPEVLASGHALVARLTERLEKSLPDVPPVSALARELCVSERTLARHVRHATGKSTSSLVQSVKMRRARALLENSRMTIDQIAAAVGYQDATALRRLVRKAAGVSPAHFRAAASVGR
ncbi:helix-turn-helix domain-containing protein [Luteimonas sp. MC1782]|uniref:GlxA family transcriptional regulator n=1 Tax=Luteimonas sp. MC1782 TaxID=2760305 RepID=UPI001603C814|nr:helix-turn-helix domain-containing protein [Luteimonas sp. MC1782]MBB1472487.1 helix-turn-helix domain-containing protein [Luteimonas sp. MC1782]